MAYKRHQDTYITWNGYCVLALVRGGLLWRLLVNALGYDNTSLKELDILDGHCRYDREVTVSGRWFVEAIVSPHNKNVLCGIYKLLSRSIGIIKHSAADICELDAAKTDSFNYSWWPKALIWESLGMNYNYWGALQEA
jgi:hypothetical protein